MPYIIPNPPLKIITNNNILIMEIDITSSPSSRSPSATTPTTAPIEVLIKDEVHEPVSFEFGSAEEIPIDQPPIPKRRYNFRQKKINKSNQTKVTVPKTITFMCTECNINFADKKHLEIHQSGHANNLRCSICTTILKNFKNYEKHVLNCKPFECKVCGKTIRFRPNFIKHMRIHNPKKNAVSSSEDPKQTGTTKVAKESKTSNATGNTTHIKSNAASKSERHKYKCDKCEKEFTSWEYFKVHQKIHEKDVNLKCEICDKTFSAFSCLKGHQKVHTGERPYRCDVCGKKFGQSYNLKIHLRLHTGEKPFECKVCNRKMNTTASYKAHMRTHKDFKCAICNETFNQKMKYMSHMGMHETGKVLECKICGKKFGRSSNFYNHQRIHLGIKKFKCYICGLGFVKATNLDAHLLIHCDSDLASVASSKSDNNDDGNITNELQGTQNEDEININGQIINSTSIEENDEHNNIEQNKISTNTNRNSDEETNHFHFDNIDELNSSPFQGLMYNL